MSDPAVSLSDGRPVLKNEQQAEPAQGALIPPKAVPYLTALVAAALVAARALPPHTIGAQVANAITEVAVLFGLASPGWRRR